MYGSFYFFSDIQDQASTYSTQPHSAVTDHSKMIEYLSPTDRLTGKYRIPLLLDLKQNTCHALAFYKQFKYTIATYEFCRRHVDMSTTFVKLTM